jgi:hypothetical protein
VVYVGVKFEDRTSDSFRVNQIAHFVTTAATQMLPILIVNHHCGVSCHVILGRGVAMTVPLMAGVCEMFPPTHPTARPTADDEHRCVDRQKLKWKWCFLHHV